MFERTKKMSKIKAVGLILVVGAIGVMAGTAILTYYANITDDGTISTAFQFQDGDTYTTWTNMEDLVLSDTLVDGYDFEMKKIRDLGDIDVWFNESGIDTDEDDYFILHIWDDNTPAVDVLNSYYTFDDLDSHNFTVEILISELAPAGDVEPDLVIEPNLTPIE